MNARDISTAMRNAGYRRQWHWGRWRVVYWAPGNLFPAPADRSPADRKAIIRTVMKCKKVSVENWDEILMLLPAVGSFDEISRADVGASEAHRLFDNLDLINGDSVPDGET